MFPGGWSNGSTINSTLNSLNIKLCFKVYYLKLASICKKTSQYKTIGGEILVPRY